MRFPPTTIRLRIIASVALLSGFAGTTPVYARHDDRSDARAIQSDAQIKDQGDRDNKRAGNDREGQAGESHAEQEQAHGQPLLYLSPNGGSRDMLTLFQYPESWPSVLHRMDVFSINLYNLSDPPSAACKQWCGPNTFPALKAVDAFRELKRWGKRLDVQMEPISPSPAGARVAARDNADARAQMTLAGLDNLTAAGGEVASITLDEPLQFATRDTFHNNYTLQETLDAVKHYEQVIRSRYPAVRIGEFMPYPYFSAQQIMDWYDAEIAAGAAPSHVHLDVNYPRLLAPGHAAELARFRRDLPQLIGYFRKRGIVPGITFDSTDAGHLNSNQQFYRLTMRHFELVRSILPALPEHIRFESWDNDPGGKKLWPDNLPEDGNYSLTCLINLILKLAPVTSCAEK